MTIPTHNRRSRRWIVAALISVVVALGAAVVILAVIVARADRPPAAAQPSLAGSNSPQASSSSATTAPPATSADVLEIANPSWPDIDAPMGGGWGSDVAPTPGTANITLPESYEIASGDLEMVTGFPKTPEGAAAQLAQVSTQLFTSISSDGWMDILDWWTVPGTDYAEWMAPARALDGEISRVKISQVWISKPADNGNAVYACVLGRRTNVADGQYPITQCALMRWQVDRWRADPSVPITLPPNAWALSKESYELGFHDIDWEPDEQ